MTASIAFYDSFRLYEADETGAANASLTFKATLHDANYTPDAATHSVYADLSHELSTANGYTSGGVTLTGVTLTRTGTTVKFTFTGPFPQWTASGGSLVARWCVIRASDTVNGHIGPLMLYILMDNTPANITITDTNTLTITPNASGLWTLT